MEAKRHLSTFKHTKTATQVAEEEKAPNIDVKSNERVHDPPVIFLADSKEILDLDRPEKLEQWQQVLNKNQLPKSRLKEAGESPKQEKSEPKKLLIGVNWKHIHDQSSRAEKLRQLPALYLQLSKFRLTMLVAATSAGGYGMVTTEVFEPSLFLASTVGVMLVSASANTVNQFLEVPFDSQMARTRNRPLVRGLLSPGHALGYALASGAGGTAILGLLVNPMAAGIGLANLFLYTTVYTPMKRLTVYNTWVGSVVGALPPLIGWVSASGGTLDPGAFVLAGILFAWQFPHFNALSWNLRPDYSKAGYRMMSVTDPGLCRRTTLRYSVACTAICSLMAPGLGLTDLNFAWQSLPFNAILTYLSWNFYRNPDANSSRKLFRFTLIHLPLLMTLLFIAKQKHSRSEEHESR